MRLSQLFDGQVLEHDPDISGLTADSRQVKAGYLFAALAGTQDDGARFVADAVRRGAAAVLAGESVKGNQFGIPLIIDAQPRLRLAKAAAKFYGRQPAHIVAVTGTNGKTSVATFTRQIFASIGFKAASFGTVGVVSPQGTRSLSHTTPDPVAIHHLLSELHSEGVTHLAFEASSIGLAHHRVDGVQLEAAAFTNLTRDHLDFHKTFDEYRTAKLRLFSEVLPSRGRAVINVDSPEAPAFLDAARTRSQTIVTVGESPADLRLLQRVPHLRGQELTLEWEGQRFDVALPLAGGFQASNAMVSAGLVLALGHPAPNVFAALARLTGAAGRLELAGVSRAGASVFVDYAHTPDALETVLKALRPHTDGKLWVVFGCGGDRDAGKRPLMGQAAAEHADCVIVTDDNPRSEVPSVIRAAVLAGAPQALDIGDRALAIEAAVEKARSGDIVVIAGKGHETGQTVGHDVLPFSDIEVARALISPERS